MTLIRALAIGLLAGSAGVPIFETRGEGLDHLRLAVLTGLLLGQFLTVPVSLVAGGIRAFARRGRPARRGGLPLGVLLVAFGVLVVTQAWAVGSWLDTTPAPSGVGDPDGEVSIALLAGLSGCLAVLVGLVLLAKRRAVSGRARRQVDGGPPQRHLGS
ncbi:hypothetical protein [Streptomyces sp. NPDC059909]|uniref:hypothetical protein n=1 Tax=Streptomyces sp. NPDC059909 TaxID=3346998 RepID=UPI00364ADEE1